MHDDLKSRPAQNPHRALADGDYRALAAAVPQLIWAAGPDGVVDFLNEQWSTYTGISLDELRRMPRETLVHPDDRPKVLEAWARGRRDGAGFESRFRLRDAASNWRWQLSRGVPMHDDAGRLARWVGTITDIHDLVVAEQEAERLRAVAESATRMKDEFLATVSHELRAPLNAIGGWAGVLRVGKLDAEGIAKAATVIEKNVRVQAKMIEDLLDVSRIVSGKLRLDVRAFDPSVAVEGAIEALRPAAMAKDIRMEYAKWAVPAPVSGDPNRLQQAVWNLISNAVKFTEPGGTVTVTLSERDGDAEIAISDTGLGIAPEFLPQLFERFQQADGPSQRRFGGLGLGLAIVRHIVELHDGAVEARSEGEGRGATFIVRIPLATKARAAAGELDDAARRTIANERRATAAGSLAGLRLLSVDDEADASEMLKAALEQYGAQVTTVASAAAALEILEHERFDVLVSDIGMPGMDGYELLERIRGGTAHARAIPAIAVTGYARSEDRARALQAGYGAHVVKPIEPEELAATVRAAAASSRQ
ncbi:MAG: hybrid sensor histidine kinase/response regulator [Gammaproteobacteria bacterium]